MVFRYCWQTVLLGFAFGFALGLRRLAPSDELYAWVQEHDDLDELYAAVFCVCRLRPGTSLDRMKGMMLQAGSDLVAARSYSLVGLNPMDHVIAAECMVRIR